MKAQEFARRRRQLMRIVGEGGIAILPSAPVRKRSRDVEYRFRQDSDFYYLSGFTEPDSLLVLLPVVMLVIRRVGESRLRTWLGDGLDRDRELLATTSGAWRNTRSSDSSMSRRISPEGKWGERRATTASRTSSEGVPRRVKASP